MQDILGGILMAILVDMTELDKKREAISSTARYYSSKANTFTYSSFNSSYCSKMSNYLSGINEIYKDISKNLYSTSSYLASYLIDIRNVESKYKKILDVTIHIIDQDKLGEDWLADIHNVGSGVGNMAIPVATSIILNALCPIAGIAPGAVQSTEDRNQAKINLLKIDIRNLERKVNNLRE